MAIAAARKLPRFRSKHRGVCYCCGNGLLVGSGINKLPLYPVGTIVGVKLCCAECCRNTYNVRPGFTLDGCRMSDRFATQEGIAAVERENEAARSRRSTPTS